MPTPPKLPPGVQVFERGWLSANNVLLRDAHGSWLVDTGHARHAAQTLALVQAGLLGRPLDHIVNTHLHSDHCGGNAALQTAHPQARTWVPASSWPAVQAWDEATLSYGATGQECERFTAQAALAPGDALPMAGMDWQVIAAPGHDDDAVMLFEPAHGVLIAGDAIWGQGLSVVFPELVQEGEPPSADATQAAFAAVAATLDRIEQLQPRVVIPGHGPPFTDLAAALAQSRSRLAHFRAHPDAHALYAAKVLLKFHLLTVQRITRPALLAWARGTPYMRGARERLAPGQEMDAWLGELVHALAASGAAAIDGGHVLNR